MPDAWNTADAKAYAASYLVRCLLQALEARMPGLIDTIQRGVEGDHAGCGDMAGTLPEAIFNEALRLLRSAQVTPDPS